MAGFFDGLLDSIQNPLFLGGVGLMSGGAPGMQQGLQAGGQFADKRKKQMAVQNGLQAIQGLSDGERQAFAADPEIGLSYLAKMATERNNPMTEINRKMAEEQLRMMPLEYKAKLGQVDFNNLQTQQLRQKMEQDKATNAMFASLVSSPNNSSPHGKPLAPSVQQDGPGKFSPSMSLVGDSQEAPTPPPQSTLQSIYAQLSPEKQTAFKLAWQSGQKDEAIGILKASTDGLGPYKGAKEMSDVSEGLRKEYATIAKPYFEVRDAYARVNESAKDPSPAGDLALLFNYMKMLDPGSVVRESEFATAARAGSLPDVIQAQANRVLSGERLTSGMRNDFVNKAHGLMVRQQNQYQKIQTQYSNIAKRMKIDPQNVIIDFTAPPEESAPPANAASKTYDLGDKFSVEVH